MENEGISNKIERIYKWHNGLVMEEELNRRTKGRFKYDPQKKDCYLFKNESGKEIMLDMYGELIHEGVSIERQFSIICKKRIKKTNEMINYFS